jgi:hypothetical protein
MIKRVLMPHHKEKRYSNTRVRRHPGEIVVHSSKKTNRHKDGDTESEVFTPSSSDAILVPPPPDNKCPFRFLLASLLDTGDEEGRAGCPLKRVQIWHTLPLCLLAVVNLLLVVMALLGLAGYRIGMGIKDFFFNLAKSDIYTYDDDTIAADVVSTTTARRA